MTTRLATIIIILIVPVMLVSCVENTPQDNTVIAETATKLIPPTETLVPSATNTYTPVPSKTPTPTETQTPSPTITFMPSVTPTPTETHIPKPVSISGTVYLSSDNNPYITEIELRAKDSFELIGNAVTNANGEFVVNEIMPGKYELWVLITKRAAMIAKCNDVLPPIGWKTGIAFGGEKGLTMNRGYLSNTFMFYEGFKSPELTATGFYAVKSVLKVEIGTENILEIVLECE